MAGPITNFNQQAMDQQMMIDQMRRAQAFGGGCRPPMGPFGGCMPCPQPPWQQQAGNLPYAQVGNPGWFSNGTQGYGVDLNGNGRYDRGQDGVLAMDLNRDGKVDKNEIEQSRKRLMAFGGNYDFNGDGRVGLFERIQGGALRGSMQQYDTNGDGQLQPWEFAQAGGRVLVDQNQNGNFGRGEQYSPYGFPTPGFGSGSLGTVNPFWNQTGVNRNGGFGGGWGAPGFGEPAWNPRFGY